MTDQFIARAQPPASRSPILQRERPSDHSPSDTVELIVIDELAVLFVGYTFLTIRRYLVAIPTELEARIKQFPDGAWIEEHVAMLPNVPRLS